ncbi:MULTISPECIES: CoA ester lyase [Pigmentiphaga]|uniref:CoA ester lyase n=1 Tax=Pigmentiphaga daeguensis TaxID=414049 RepID=A0ABN1B9U8_9BURK|nr:CoA ester lyase [Pigmentiphaga sp. D-2]
MKRVRSALFVPGDRPERLPKALASGADAVIVDLEDAVEPGAKAAARAAVAASLKACADRSVVVRVNAIQTIYFDEDIALCAASPAVAAVMLPKSESAADMARAASAGRPVWPLIESARGVLALAAIADAPGVERLVFGSLDFALDLDLDPVSAAGRAVLDDARHRMLLHARGADLPAPLDGVHPQLDDIDGLRAEAARARGAGMGGMLCVHPVQVAAINEAFSPSDAELAWARRVVEAAAGQRGAFRLEGRMVDAPVLARARRMMEAAGRA